MPDGWYRNSPVKVLQALLHPLQLKMWPAATHSWQPQPYTRSGFFYRSYYTGLLHRVRSPRWEVRKSN